MARVASPTVQPEGVARTVQFTVPAMPSPARSKDPVSGKMKINKSLPMKPKLIGYYTAGKHPNFARMNEMNLFKDHIRKHAPVEFHDLTANQYADRLVINVECWFFNGVHNDVENVRKLLGDTLCTGGDKWVSGSHGFPQYDSEFPRMEVSITRWDPVITA